MNLEVVEEELGRLRELSPEDGCCLFGSGGIGPEMLGAGVNAFEEDSRLSSCEMPEEDTDEAEEGVCV